eukprot:2878185-Rhodomonas_salina.1
MSGPGIACVAVLCTCRAEPGTDFGCAAPRPRGFSALEWEWRRERRGSEVEWLEGGMEKSRGGGGSEEREGERERCSM